MVKSTGRWPGYYATIIQKGLGTNQSDEVFGSCGRRGEGEQRYTGLTSPRIRCGVQTNRQETREEKIYFKTTAQNHPGPVPRETLDPAHQITQASVRKKAEQEMMLKSTGNSTTSVITVRLTSAELDGLGI